MKNQITKRFSQPKPILVRGDRLSLKLNFANTGKRHINKSKLSKPSLARPRFRKHICFPSESFCYKCATFVNKLDAYRRSRNEKM